MKLQNVCVLATLLGAVVLVVACDDGDGGATSTATGAAPPVATSARDALPAITIDTPAENATVQVPFEVAGTANVFEGALVVQVLGNAAGLVLCERNVQATSGTGERGSWSAVMAFLPPPADSPVTLRAFDRSAKDGSEENVVERPISVLADQPNIVITSPRCSETVSGALIVTGNAQVFEAALSVDIRDASGTALLTQNVLAALGGERSPWTATFDLSALPGGAGLYDLVAYTHSARDGSIIDEFAVPIIVRP